MSRKCPACGGTDFLKGPEGGLKRETASLKERLEAWREYALAEREHYYSAYSSRRANRVDAAYARLVALGELKEEHGNQG